MEDKRMIGDYQVINSMYIGHRDIILGENPDAVKEERYLCCYVEQTPLFERYTEAIASDDFAEIVKIYGERMTRAAEDFIKEEETAKAEIGENEEIANGKCTKITWEESIENKVIVIKGNVLRPEFRHASHQLYLCTGGFGAQPNARGRTCYCTSLLDGRKTSYYLYITVSHKTVDEMMAHYGFTDDQKSRVAELLAQDSSMWAAVLYGIYGADDQIVAVALSQIGNVGGEPYWSWYGFSSRVEWCACFVSWCANQCGYIETGVIPKYAGCVNGVNWFKDRGQWADNDIEPAPGMIIFFDWDNKGSSGPQDGQSDHTGIVERVEDGFVYTVEGNSEIAAVRIVMLWDTMKSWVTVSLPVNSKCHPVGWHLHMNVLIFV